MDTVMGDIEIKREKTYLMALVLAPVFAAVIVFYLAIDGAEYAFLSNGAQDLNFGIIEAFEDSSQKADIGVIMLGNSRLRYGNTFGFDPEKPVQLPDGRKMAALKFTLNAAEFKNYETYADAVLMAKPDYIVLLDMLLTNMRPPGRTFFAHYSNMVYQAWLYRFRNLSPEQVWLQNRYDIKMNCYDRYTLSMMNRRIAGTASRDRHSLDPEENENIDLVRGFIRKAIAQGIQVIVLHMPSNTDVLDEYNVPYYYVDSYGLDHRPAPAEMLPDLHDQVTWLSYPAPDDRRSYCDFLHLNETGRQDFDHWFFDTIQDL